MRVNSRLERVKRGRRASQRRTAQNRGGSKWIIRVAGSEIFAGLLRYAKSYNTSFIFLQKAFGCEYVLRHFTERVHVDRDLVRVDEG